MCPVRLSWRCCVKPPPFRYHRPESLDEALALMAEHGSDARPLAGGQSLLPLLAMRVVRPGHVVDLQRVPEFRDVSVRKEELRIGAMVRQRDVEHDARMPRLVRAAVAHIGNLVIRNRGTVGGSLAHMDPAAEWPAIASVLDAVVVAVSARGRRAIPASDFASGLNTTALAGDELVAEVVLPTRDARFGFAEVSRRGGGDFALAGAVCRDNAVAVFAVGPRPQRLTSVEALLASGGNAEEASRLAASEIVAVDDVHASGAYRRRVAAALVGRVVSHARAGGSKWS